MRAIKIAALASAMALPFAASTYAADAVMQVPEPPAAPQIEPAPVQLWTGPYAGVFLGYDWGEFDGIDGDDGDSISGGGYAGYNWQAGDVVFGVEGDIGYGQSEESDGVNTAEKGVFGSARARVGYAFNPFMVYATGGAAAANIDVTDDATGASDSNTALGYTVGGGVEGFVTDNVTARVEYRYTDYGSDDYNVGTTVSSGYDEHSVRAGIGFKF